MDDDAVWVLSRQALMWLESLPRRSQVPARPEWAEDTDDGTRALMLQDQLERLQLAAYDLVMGMKQGYRRLRWVRPTIEHQPLARAVDAYVGSFDRAQLRRLRNLLEHIDVFMAQGVEEGWRAANMGTWQEHLAERDRSLRIGSEKIFEQFRDNPAPGVSFDRSGINSIWFLGRTYPLRPTLDAAARVCPLLRESLPPIPYSLLQGGAASSS